MSEALECIRTKLSQVAPEPIGQLEQLDEDLMDFMAINNLAE